MSHAPQDPSPEQSARIDRLARAARTRPPGTLPDALWQPVLALESWWLVVEDLPGGISPCVAEVDSTKAMLVFTTRSRARSALPALHAQTPPVVAAVTPAYVVQRSQVYASAGVEILLLDCQDTAFFAPVSSLHGLWRRHFGEYVTASQADVEPVLVDEASTPSPGDPPAQGSEAPAQDAR